MGLGDWVSPSLTVSGLTTAQIGLAAAAPLLSHTRCVARRHDPLQVPLREYGRGIVTKPLGSAAAPQYCATSADLQCCSGRFARSEAGRDASAAWVDAQIWLG